MDPSFNESGGFFPGIPIVFLVFFVLVALFIAVVFVRVIVGGVRNSRALREAGVDPLTLQSQMALRYLGRRPAGTGPGVGAGPGGTEHRLRELDRLRDRGVISTEEHAGARQRILGEL